MDADRARAFIDSQWEDSILPVLHDYVAIPALSPAFDAAWRENGHLQRAVELVAGWCAEQPIGGLQVEVVELPDRTPLLWLEIPGDGEGTVLLYGHLDKQPEMTGWAEGLGPWNPVRRGDRLYGRGGADDGYAAFASLLALRALREHGGRHARCVVLIEASEESGSPDLPAFVEHLAERIGDPDLVICLDSGCGDYDRLWSTTSLRGMAIGTLSVDVLEEGVHSGDAGGVVPDSFRIVRHLLGRLEDDTTGALRPAAFHVDIPEVRRQQALQAAGVLGDQTYRRFPLAGETGPQTDRHEELVLNRTWRPALTVTGADGLPPLSAAGNVLRPGTSVKVSLRLPPTCDAEAATVELGRALTIDPPHGARVRFEPDVAASGWNAPPVQGWLERAAREASREYFGPDAASMGEGGSIPFMAMLGERFPEAQFFITGVLGPESNAHGPNEFLHVPTAKRVTGCVARLLAAHHQESVRR